MNDITVTMIPKEEMPILRNLAKMYAYEWSQFNLYDVDKNGNFEFEYQLPWFWEKENYFPYFIKVDGKLAGFVLIDDDCPMHKDAQYSISEFFVMHKYRRTGAGRFAAKTMFDSYHGKWDIGMHPGNLGASKFWNNVVSEYTGGKFEFTKAFPGVVYNDGSLMDVISFSN